MDLITTLLLVLIGVIVGFLLHALVGSIRKQPEGPAAAQAPPPASYPDDAVHLWREPGSRQLRVGAGGKVFRSAAELDDGQQERLGRYAGDLGSWLGWPGEFDRSVVPSSQQSLQESFPASPPHPGPPALPSDPVKAEAEGPDLNPFKIFTRVFQSPEKATVETEPGSIVAQIDALLQARLEGTHLADRGIRLVETPNQGMFVQIGQESYPGVEAVPDPEVRAAIRQAVADWEASLDK